MRRVPWAALALGGLLLGGWALATALGRGWIGLPPCPFKALTGLPCLSCGLTRWGLALRAGDLRGAWHWHPGATLMLGAVPGLIGADLARAWRGRPYPPLPDAAWARWSAAGLLLLFWGLQVARGV